MSRVTVLPHDPDWARAFAAEAAAIEAALGGLWARTASGRTTCTSSRAAHRTLCGIWPSGITCARCRMWREPIQI
jgi:hypothetical protein